MRPSLLNRGSARTREGSSPAAVGPAAPRDAAVEAAGPGSRGPAERAAAEHRDLGFTSVIRHLSLRGWLRWIRSNECDATLRVRTRDGGSGCIWCSAGKVVDADWGALSGEAALMELLRLQSGSVSIDFDPVERPRRVARRSGVLEVASDASAAAGAPAPARGSSRAESVAGGMLLSALVLLAFAFGRWRAAADDGRAMVREAPRAQETQALLPPPPVRKPAAPATELPAIAFTRLEIEPAQAEIWLDHALIGLGQVELAPLADGELHELRFVAPGHATRSLYFVGAPPSGRVQLEPVESAAAAAALAGGGAGRGAEPGLAPAPPGREAPRLAPRAVPRRRAAAVAASGSPAPSAPAAPSSQKGTAASKDSAEVQLSDAQTPRVRVLD